MPTPSQVEATLVSQQKRGTCSHPDAPHSCTAGAIRAHSLQRATALKAIQENGHVYSARILINEDGSRGIREEGVRNASTFFGFCGRHDDELFKPIESGGIPLDQRAAFLLSFRAVAMEVLIRKRMIAGSLKAKLDAGCTLKEQQVIVNGIWNSLRATRAGLVDFEEWKIRLDDMYRSNDFSSLDMLMIEFAGDIPFVSSGAILPWFDLNADLIQDLITADDPDSMTFVLTHNGQNSIMICCWEKDRSGAPKKLIESFLDQPDDLKATAAAVLAIAYSENTFIRKSWWDSLYPLQQQRIKFAMDFGTGGSEDRQARSQVTLPYFAPFKLKIMPQNIEWLG